jgi:hypothetical protein
MQETKGFTVWIEADEKGSVASYHAYFTQKLGYWLHATCGALLIPFFGTGIFGFFLLAGIVVMAVAIPVRAALWHGRFRALDSENPEIIAARKTLHQALVLWALGPLTFCIVVTAILLVYGPLSRR